MSNAGTVRIGAGLGVSCRGSECADALQPDNAVGFLTDIILHLAADQAGTKRLATVAVIGEEGWGQVGQASPVVPKG